MKKTSVLAAIAIVLASAAMAQRTTRKGLKPAPATTATAAETVASSLDTLAAPEPHQVDINGYDKPLRSRRETFFATNNSGRDIAGLAFTIKYFDSQQRMLHSASHNIAIDIPAGETRQASVKSWDPQFNFYYVRSTVPQRVQQATPYDVTLTVDTIFVKK